VSWLVRMVPGYAPDGGPVVSVLAKRTYRFNPGETALPDPGTPMDWVEVDEHWDTNNPATDPMKLESELVAWKPCTDVVVVGNAHAPRGKRARFFDAGIQIGAFRKVVRVFGNRMVVPRFSGFDFSEPEPFETMPLHYGLAYGGRYERPDGLELSYPRNPVGTGFLVSPELSDLLGTRLPNLEDPNQVLTPQTLVLKAYDAWPTAPKPWALGYTGRNFHPRVTMAGLPPEEAMEAEVVRLQAVADRDGKAIQPPTPVMNLQYHNGASEGLVLPYLRGDETVVLTYLDPDHPSFQFRLPGSRPVARLDVGQGREWMDMVLQNIVVYKGTNQLAMVWRGCCRYDGPESMADWTRLEMGVED